MDSQLKIWILCGQQGSSDDRRDWVVAAGSREVIEGMRETYQVRADELDAEFETDCPRKSHSCVTRSDVDWLEAMERNFIASLKDGRRACPDPAYLPSRYEQTSYGVVEVPLATYSLEETPLGTCGSP